MAKAPLVGAVKTRLVPPLTSTEAAELSACFLSDTMNNISTVGTLRSTEGLIVYTPASARNVFDELIPPDFQLLAQRGETLGERLLNATRDLLARGYESICLINSDSPTLPTKLLSSAVSALEPAGDRVVLGPAEDGGYYLIGLKRPHENLFDRIAWSTSDVLAHTVERAKQLSLDVVMLPAWYDIDDAAALERLCDELFRPPSTSNNGHTAYPATFTREYLARLLEESGRDNIWPTVTTGSKR